MTALIDYELMLLDKIQEIIGTLFFDNIFYLIVYVFIARVLHI